MDEFIIFIILVAIAGVVLNVLFWGAIVGLFVYLFSGHIAKSVTAFQNMSPQDRIRTLQTLQRIGRMGQAQSYYNSMESPRQMELGGLAASMGWDPTTFENR